MAGDVTLNQVSSAKHTTSVLLEMFFFFWVFTFLVQDSITIHF